MSYYFLTWDAKSGELGWAEEQAAELREKSRLSFLWSCGNTKRIESGDTVFFLRQRMEPRGIAGFGYVVKPPHSRPHWKPERRAAGATTLCVEVAWEYFELEPVVSRERLRTPRRRSAFRDVDTGRRWFRLRSGIFERRGCDEQPSSGRVAGDHVTYRRKTNNRRERL